MHCSTLQHTASHPNTLPHTEKHCNTLQHATTCCNMLQHAATCCNILQHAATCCNMLQHAATCCNMLQHAATCCSTLAITLDSCLKRPSKKTLTATQCNTIATHRNTLQDTFYNIPKIRNVLCSISIKPETCILFMYYVHQIHIMCTSAKKHKLSVTSCSLCIRGGKMKVPTSVSQQI